ncbi:PAS domain S-box protein [Guptibacillus algicola]|uniref:PAS domain S-box protein n=1 Tax=Guptibacillus algicola TaxID=225844 RepID=UPI001CD53F64|nr:PAS domain S-box protein [Alkalihalobacillus algicola]MCA0988513.1 PAS domain S-box protein [Alkalihalobacillus algicola]
MMEQQPAIGNLTGNEKAHVFKQSLEYSNEAIVIHSNHEILFINQSGADFLDGTKDHIIGLDVLDLFKSDQRDYVKARIEKMMTERQIGKIFETEMFNLDGSLIEVEWYCHAVVFGNVPAIQSIIRDITSRKNSDRKLKEVLDEIGLPIVPVFDGIAVFPLIGMLDDERIEHVLDNIPRKVHEKKLQHLIVDVSGIYTINDGVALFLFKMKAVLELLGVSTIYTGFRPELVQKAVQAGLDIGSLRTVASVQHALKGLNST